MIQKKTTISRVLVLTPLLAVFFYSCKQKEAVTPTSVTVSPATVSLVEGETQKLSATVQPKDAEYDGISWSSSAPEIATVGKDGQVTAVKAGSATITAKAGSVSGTCKVTVNAAPPQTIAVTGVTVSMSFVELTEGGDPYQLTVTVLPENASNKEVTWASADESVATVKDGLVTPVAPGETSITVTTVDGGKTDKCTVSVVAKEVPATGVTVDPESVEIMEGKTCQLKATVSPEGADQTVEWTAQQSSIATVDENGLVTAISPGETRIYVRSSAYPDMTAYCEVTVTQDGTLKGIALDASEIQLQVGKSRTLTVIYQPEYATNKNVSWTSSNQSVAKVKDGTVTALEEGTATITATSEEGGFTASCNVTVSQAEGPFIYYNYYGSLFVNGEKDPLTSAYDIDEWECYRGTEYMDSDGKDLYSLIGFGYDSWLAKNHKPILDVEDLLPPFPKMLWARNGVFAVLGNVGQYTFDIMRATEAGDVKTITVSTSANIIHSVGVDVAPDGTIYAAVRMQDVFSNKVSYFYTIQPDGSYTEKLLETTDYTFNPHVSVSAEGDAYVFGGRYDEEYKQVGALFKNGQLEKLIDRVDYNFSGALACQGGHVYTAVSDFTKNEIRIHKDGETIYTIHDDSGAFLVDSSTSRALRVTSNGDVYLSWSNGDGVNFLSKNGQPLYTSTEVSYDTFCIVE